MISSKATTQNWSKAPQVSALAEDKNNYTAAAGNKKVATPTDEKAWGDRLNEIANPGGHNAAAKPRKANGEMGKDDFMKLMLTQMKNQDPMNPMQSHEMAAQLAQFTSLEQLVNVNKNLEGLTKAQDPLQKFQVLGLLGKSIKADSKEIFRTSTDQPSDLRFELLGDAATVKLEIADEEGKTVRTIDFGGLKKGQNKVAWNGKDDKDMDVKPGKYSFRIAAESSGGGKIGIVTETKGTISGVNYTPEGPVLLVGNQSVRLQDIQKIEDDAAKQSDPLANQVATQGLESKVPPNPVKPETKDEKKIEGVMAPVAFSSSGSGAMKVGGKIGNK